MGDGRRIRRIEEAVRAFMAESLLAELGDPRLAGLVVTSVSVSADLGIARVSVRLLAGDEDSTARRKVVQALEHASGRLRRGLGKSLGMKKTPELRFAYDAGHDAERRIDAVLREIHADAGPEDDSEPPSSAS